MTLTAMVDLLTRDALMDYVNGGARIDYTFFWGHRPNRDGSIGKGCLSQWFESPFKVDNIHYATAEHYMMAEKARLFDDRETLAKILDTANPGAAKALGREIRGFDDALWIKHRTSIVVRGNLAKFSQNAKLAEFLKNTGDRVLVEASPIDRIWGIGLAEDDPSASNPNTWKGLNLLGFALMQVRQQLNDL
jgi:hypothetical protein